MEKAEYIKKLQKKGYSATEAEAIFYEDQEAEKEGMLPLPPDSFLEKPIVTNFP